MKQGKLKIAIMAACAGFVLCAGSASQAADHVGKVLAIIRDVYRITEDGTEKAGQNMGLAVKDEVATGKQSRARLKIMNTSDASLTELSRLLIEDWLYDSRVDRSRSILRLDEGAIRVIVRDADMEVHTEAAVADAKGTAFVVWTEKVKKDTGKELVERTCSMTLEGSVEFRIKKRAVPGSPGKSSIIINAGMMSCIEGDILEELRPIERHMMDYWKGQFPVMANVISFDRELEAFIPEHAFPGTVIEIPDVDQPPLQVPAVNVNPRVLFRAP